MYITTSVILVTTAALLLYKYFTRNFRYWKEKGFPYIKPLPLFGNFLAVFSFRTHMGHFVAKLHHQHNYPYIGTFLFNKPCLIIRDVDLIKSILVKDFKHFVDHVGGCDRTSDPLSSQFLFFLKNPDWKIVRDRVTPVFSVSRIKRMVVLIKDAAAELQIYLNKNTRNHSIEAKEICARYATDVIASCAFGIQANCFQYENAEFRLVGRKLFESNWKSSLRQEIFFLLPDLVNLLKLEFLDPSVAEFLRDVFWKTIKLREKSNCSRNDLIDVLIQMRKTCTKENTFENDSVIAQACQFLLAGFETVASAMAFALYELCLHQDVQKKVRTEMQTVLNTFGEFNCEAEQSLKYLQMVVYETLRKYPSIPFLDRICVEDYEIPNSSLVIEKRTPIFISILGLHYDPHYFPNPEEFIPERFSTENSEVRNSFVYMPFGRGPRMCVGERFGLTVMKLGLAYILSEFEVERSADTPVPMEYNTKGFLLASAAGLPLKFKKIQDGFSNNKS